MKATHSMIDANTRDITKELLLPGNKLKILSYNDYQQFTRPEIQLFCMKNARYGLPTIELIAFLKGEIGQDINETIEIGAGSGDLGSNLGIKMVDNKMQSYGLIKNMYENMSQPTIKYPEEIEEIDANEAIKKYKPKVVVASWVTQYSHIYQNNGCLYGVKERHFINKIKRYIFIGNRNTHGKKDICKLPHEEWLLPFNLSRATHPEDNVVWIWENESL